MIDAETLKAKLDVIREIARCALDGTLAELSVESDAEAWDLVLSEAGSADA